MGMKGYKAFDKDLKCKDFQYEIGKTYEMDGEIKCCERGFHFCKDLADCYRYYAMTDATRICKVEAVGEIIKTEDGIKYCTNKIKILSEVENPRIKTNVSTSSGYRNSGFNNSGNANSGDYNSGNFNSGDSNRGNLNSGRYNIGDRNSGNCNDGNLNTGNWNTGDYNTGDRNSGYRNSGDFNSGHWNAGEYNSGDRNSGYCNSGNRNSGEWNKGNRHTGVFNCDAEPKIRMFDKESNWTMKDWQDSKACIVMLGCPMYKYSDNENEELKYIETVAEDRQEWWDNELTEDDKDAVKSLPNFDADKFYLCTGIRV